MSAGAARGSRRGDQEEATGMEPGGSRFARYAGLAGAAIALVAAVIFAAAASGSTPVARYGGGAWVFILVWIILMPLLAPWLKQRGTR